MKRRLFLFLILTSLNLMASGTEGDKTMVKKSIQVVDSENGEPIIGADIHIEGLSEVLFTDPDGYVHFECRVDQKVEIQISYISYQDVVLSLESSADLETVNLPSR